MRTEAVERAESGDELDVAESTGPTHSYALRDDEQGCASDDLDVAEVSGPTHSYGLRDQGGGLWVVVRVDGDREEVVSRPNRKALALHTMLERVEQDEWR